jgi:hypothetical protein
MGLRLSLRDSDGEGIGGCHAGLWDSGGGGPPAGGEGRDSRARSGDSAERDSDGEGLGWWGLGWLVSPAEGLGLPGRLGWRRTGPKCATPS